MATLEVQVKVQDMRWFQEIAVRIGDLLDTLDDVDLPDSIVNKVTALRSAVFAKPVDDQPEP